MSGRCERAGVAFSLTLHSKSETFPFAMGTVGYNIQTGQCCVERPLANVGWRRSTICYSRRQNGN